MASMFGSAYQVTNMVVEIIFVLDHRLREHANRRRSLKKTCDDSTLCLLFAGIVESSFRRGYETFKTR